MRRFHLLSFFWIFLKLFFSTWVLFFPFPVSRKFLVSLLLSFLLFIYWDKVSHNPSRLWIVYAAEDNLEVGLQVSATPLCLCSSENRTLEALCMPSKQSANQAISSVLLCPWQRRVPCQFALCETQCWVKPVSYVGNFWFRTTKVFSSFIVPYDRNEDFKVVGSRRRRQGWHPVVLGMRELKRVRERSHPKASALHPQQGYPPGLGQPDLQISAPQEEAAAEQPAQHSCTTGCQQPEVKRGVIVPSAAPRPHKPACGAPGNSWLVSIQLPGAEI